LQNYLKRILTRIKDNIFFSAILFALAILANTRANAGERYYFNINYPFVSDTTPASFLQGLLFPIKDRYGDPFSNPNRNPFNLKDPSNLRDSVIYDPKDKRYYVIERIGNQYYRKPTYLTFDEFLKIQGRKAEQDYFKKRANTLNLLNRKILKPKLSVGNDLFNRIFGNGKIEIKPQGNVDIIAGYQGQNIKNPALPEAARRNGGFDFDMNANLRVDGNIGDKLRLPINYNTLSNFDFENQFKLDYNGKDDEIIKTFQAGNVAFQSRGTLIPSAQSLFGLKTQLQFGKLFFTAVLANDRSNRQTVPLQGGSVAQSFIVKADEYEENRHFLLAQYFRRNYNKAMSTLPAVNSQVQIQRMEVWVTNRNGATTETRDVVGFMDLGEDSVYNSNITVTPGSRLPDNRNNSLYQTLTSDPDYRNPVQIQGKLAGIGLGPVVDFEKTFARKLSPQDYFFNPQIGFISVNVPLQPDEVLAVAIQYTFNGQIRQVGEFSQDVPPDTTGGGGVRPPGSQKMLFLKLLKATSQRPALPIWDLMMKNVYSVGFGNLQRQDFKLDIFYEEPSKGEKRYMPTDDVLTQYKGQPILSLLGFDRLNNQNDPQPDGVFDYVEGFTVLSQQSRIIFPVLEPFGRDLQFIYPNTQATRDKYVYYQLYDTIKAIAQTNANLNRFIIRGRSKSSNSAETYLGAFNIPPGSVTVTAGGQVLVENADYSVDYNQGIVRILNQAYINSNIPVNIQFENNASFGLQQRNFIGLRADYIAQNLPNKSFAFGMSMVKLGERPFFTKTNYNEDPIRNIMIGADLSYRSESKKLTKWLDKLPFYSTTAPSTINAVGEIARLIPGHPKQIGRGAEGLSYMDDFEGTRNGIDLRFPFISWTLASTPSTPQSNGLFPEGSLRNDLKYGFNRSRLAWYTIEPTLQDPQNSSNPLRNNLNELSDPNVRVISSAEIFPQRSVDFGQSLLNTFDMAYYPAERGPYNYDTNPTGLDASGRFTNPKKRWGGIMRGLDQIDFETNNIEFIEFWVQDPFKNAASTGGKLYFNLGNISEDVLHDSRRSFENGLSTPQNPAFVDTTSVWGTTPGNPIQVAPGFSNNPDDREFQDVGFDGLNDDGERIKFRQYLSSLRLNFPTGSAVIQQATNDPSTDNYQHYRADVYEKANSGILERYKLINNPQGNSPVATTGSTFTSAFTLYPDQEDLNRDNTLNELEEYFQYKVDLKPNMAVGSNFITDKRTVRVVLPKKKDTLINWYLFRIPITGFNEKIGDIPDFKSIRFMRMFLTDFEEPVVLRFAKLELVRNQWRRFDYRLDTTGNYTLLPRFGPSFNVLAVNIEENDKRTPVPYRIPPGIERVQQLSNNGVNILQNEQAMSMRICGLANGDARAVFRTIPYDLRQYAKLSMFIHAESINFSNDIKDNESVAVIRIGSDFVSNYYEIKIPLKVTQWNTDDPSKIWPEANSLDFNINTLTNLKSERNNAGASTSLYYKQTIGDKTYAILGNPNLGEVRGVLLGIENPANGTNEALCGEFWFNELRLSGLDESGGWAATGRVDVTLADLGTLTLSGSYRSKGFGTIEQRVNERARDDLRQFDVATNLELGKLLPKKAGISIPVYAGYSQTMSTPEYDPYDLDIKLKDKLSTAPKANRDSIRNAAVELQTITTLNFTNVRKNNTSGKKQRIWSIENFDMSYAFTKTERSNPIIEKDEVIKHRGGLGYNYSAQPKFWEPFKKLIKSRSPWLALLKEFNVNPTPSLLSFRADVNRQFGALRPRNVGGGPYKIPEAYDKYFTFDRVYNMRWDLTRTLNIDFTATNNARIDEPIGRLDTRAKKDTVRRNLLKGGRNTVYNQRANVTYALPTSKLPLLDWTNINVSFNTGYNWIGSSRLPEAISLGNTIENTQQRNITGEFDFTRLYAKSRLLRAIDQDASQAPPPAVNNTPPIVIPDSIKGRQRAKLIRKQKRQLRKQNRMSTLPEVGWAGRATGRLITSVKRIGIQYSENYNTRLPGYTDSTRFFGQNWNSMAPGLDFVFGRQPDTAWLNKADRKGLFTKDTTFSYLIQQSYDQKLTITAQLQPIRDLIIDINVDKSFNKNYTELFKDTSVGNNGIRRHVNPYAAGGFNVSYIAFNTLFEKIKPNEVSETFRKFEAYRSVLSARLGRANPNSGAVPGSEYYKGYGKYAQDVLIPAFLAAYTGKDPEKVALIKQSNANLRSNPFSKIIPRPNWRITYNGLTRLKGMEKIFTNFTVTHAYNANVSMNSYTSALLFQDRFGLGFPSFIDSSGNFVPYFLVPNISITENFAPLLDIDVQLTNQFTARFGYTKSRTLSLSLVDYQLSENRSNEFTIGMGWRKRGLPLPFGIKIGKNSAKKLQNDINFRLDYSYRNDITSNSRLDQPNTLPTGGQKVIRLAPSIDYVLNNRINIKLFLDQQKVIPNVSTAAPITTTRAGLQIRISLAQ
jgi:cell surface protein SprA